MEFKITTDLATVRDQQIDANFDEVAAWLDAELKPYVGLVVTADAIPSAKTYRANLRKVKERIEDYRKEAKKAALAPYTVFEEKAKILTGKIDKAVENIDGQIKAFENAEADAKIAEVKKYYLAAGNEEIRECCPWERIYADKWRNKGFSADMAKGSIDGAFEVVEHDLAAVRDMGGDDTPYLLDVYKQTHDLADVIRKASELKTAREREEQRKREEEEATKTFMEAVTTAAAERVAKIVRSGGNAPVKAEEPLVTVDFRVTCTKVQLNELGQWMKRNGIKYGRCK